MMITRLLYVDRYSILKRNEFREFCELALLCVFFLTILLTVTSTTDDFTLPPRKHSFKDFIEKYAPSTAWEKIDKAKMAGANFTKEQEMEMFIQAIDPADELLKLKVENGDPTVMASRSRRQMKYPMNGNLSSVAADRYNSRFRLVELMKQAIYQSRNKMVIMQILREEFRNDSYYKMGYLMAKTDHVAKTFALVATRVMRACSMKRQRREEPTVITHNFLDVIYTQERQMHLWFELDLMIELLWKNHIVAKMISTKRHHINHELWNDGRFIN